MSGAKPGSGEDELCLQAFDAWPTQAEKEEGTGAVHSQIDLAKQICFVYICGRERAQIDTDRAAVASVDTDRRPTADDDPPAHEARGAWELPRPYWATS